MQRRCATLVITLLCPFLPGANAYGVFSEFARITPETEGQLQMSVQMLPVEGQDDKCQIVVPGVWPPKRTHVIVCREKVAPERQNFREYLWSGNRKRTDVVSVTVVVPPGRSRASRPDSTARPRATHVVLHRTLLGRAYIYIDFATPIEDGGYYYCIDLSAYPLPEERSMHVRYSPAKGLGPEPGVMRRDPSDIIKVGDLYYVWYTKSHVAHGYDAKVWYAT